MDQVGVEEGGAAANVKISHFLQRTAHWLPKLNIQIMNTGGGGKIAEAVAD